MFTGIVQKMGRVSGRFERGGDLSFEIEADPALVSRVNIGDSVCVNGVCPTAPVTLSCATVESAATSTSRRITVIES